MILHQECDELVYRCAFACEKQAYRVTTEKGEYDLKNTKTKTEIVEYFKLKGMMLDSHYTLEPYKLIDKEEDVVKTVDGRMSKLYSLTHKDWNSPIEEVKLWLSPSDKSNFRYSVVNIMGSKGLGYKQGRVQEKPYWFKFIRNYFMDVCNAEEIPGFEADDALGIYADDNSVLSHIDKDIDSIDGVWHYNHVDDIIYYIPKGLGHIRFNDKKKKIIGRGRLFFYVQMLTGDDIDNIPGCLNPNKLHHKKPPKISQQEAYNLLVDYKDEQSAFNLVKQMFAVTYQDRWKEAVEECADLLWICRSPFETGRQYLKSKGFI